MIISDINNKQAAKWYKRSKQNIDSKQVIKYIDRENKSSIDRRWVIANKDEAEKSDTNIKQVTKNVDGVDKINIVAKPQKM